MSIATRRLEPERMDDPALDPAQHHEALRGLERINYYSASSDFLRSALRKLQAMEGGRPLRVLDVACGGGDVTIALNRKAREAGNTIAIDGCDISPTAVEHCRQAAQAAAINARFFHLDAMHDEMPGGYDVITCSLFLHHLSEEQVVLLMRKAAAAAPMFLADDLVRSAAGLAIAWVGSRVLTRSPIVHADGPQSVRAAFTPADLLQLAERAGLGGARVQRHFPMRMRLMWRRDGL